MVVVACGGVALAKNEMTDGREGEWTRGSTRRSGADVVKRVTEQWQLAQLV